MPADTMPTVAPMPPGLRSIEAEQSVLGGLLIDASRWDGVRAIVDEAAFTHPAYRSIFVAIEQLVLAGKVADVITVHDQLRRVGKAEACGGLVHLNELAQSVPSAANILRYAAIVADRAQRRALLAVTDGATEAVLGAENADQALETLQAELGKVKRGGAARSAPRHIGELVVRRVDELNAVAEGTQTPGMPTGLDKLDTALGGGLRPGQVVVLAARPSVGKTSLALQILLQFGRDGRPSLMLSQEMTGTELAGRALSHTGGIRMDHLALGTLESAEWANLTVGADELARLPVWVDDQPALRLVDIAAKAREVKRQHGLSLLVIDYLQLCAAETGRGDPKSRHHQIEAISRGVKALAKELDIAVLLLSQLNRAAEDGEPEMWHLKESGAVEEDADVVLLMFAHGNEPSGAMTVCLKLAKNRGGRRGRLALAFSGGMQSWDVSTTNVSRRGGRTDDTQGGAA